MLLILHFNGNAISLPSTLTKLNENPAISFARLGIECFTIIVVNCFVLISGYFGMKITIRKVLSLYLECLFYGIVCLFVLKPLNDITFKDFVNSFFAFSRSPLWFITSYIGLLLFSPILNRALNNISSKQHLYFILLLTILNCYLGWIWRAEMNVAGCSTMQLIYMYVIGFYLRTWNLKTVTKKRIVYIMGYVISSIFILLMVYVVIRMNMWGDLRVFVYNNPLNIISACFFLLLFTTFNIQSRFINWVAKSALAICIIHSYLWDIIQHEIQVQVDKLPVALFLVWAIAAIFIIYISSVLVDKIRIFLMKPLEVGMEKLLLYCKTLFEVKILIK